MDALSRSRSLSLSLFRSLSTHHPGEGGLGKRGEVIPAATAAAAVDATTAGGCRKELAHLSIGQMIIKGSEGRRGGGIRHLVMMADAAPAGRRRRRGVERILG